MELRKEIWEKQGLRKKPKSVIGKNTAVRDMLGQLHSQNNLDKLYQEYQKKKRKVMGIVVTVGLVSAISFHLSSQMEKKLADGAQLIRNEWGAGDYKVALMARAGEWSREIIFPVNERQYTVEEKKTLLKELMRVLPDLIRGNNQDLQHVEGDLKLPSSVKGYPFFLGWNSSNRERVDESGKVKREGISYEGEVVTLMVTIKDKQQEINESFEWELLLLPEILDEEERFFRLLENALLIKEKEQDWKKEIILPGNLSGKKIIWQERKTNVGIYIFMLFLLISILVGRGMDHDLKKSIQKRNKQLMAEYAGFVSMLRLYLVAGLTVKNAFAKIAADLAKQKRSKGKQCLYEELKTACFQMENGAAEELVYQEWGRRCGDMRYRRLSFLLGVYLKQGNNQLLHLLSGEVDSAREDRRNYAKKAGEEAGTKMLVPMMLMLMVVMMLVLLPAYLDFGNI